MHHLIITLRFSDSGFKMQLHEFIMDELSEHNDGVRIPLWHDDSSLSIWITSRGDIHTEMKKRLILFLALPGTSSLNSEFGWLGKKLI